MTDQLVDAALDFKEPLFQFDFQFGQVVHVEHHAHPLHGNENGHKRHLDLREQVPRVLRFEFFSQNIHQAEGHVRVGTGVGPCLANRDLHHRDLILALADERADLGHLTPQPVEAQRLQAELARCGLDQERGDHRVEGDAFDGHVVLGQHNRVELDVVAVLGDFRVRQDRR